MSSQGDVVEMYSSLAKVQMSPEQSEAVWERIDQSLAQQPVTSVRKHRRFQRIGSIAAACAALLMAAGGVTAMRHTFSKADRQAQEQVASVIHNSPPVSITSGDWKLVVYKSFASPGPYYDMTWFYVGKKTIYPVDSGTSWGQEASSGSGGDATPVRTGDSFGTFGVNPIPQGMAEAPQAKLYWKAVTGPKHTQTFDFSKAKHDIQASDFHEYAGRDSQWNVTYAYEILKGKDITYPYGAMTLTYLGKHQGKISDVVVASNSTSVAVHRNMFHSMPGNTFWTEVYPMEKSYAVTAPSATITIMANGKTDTIPLTLQKGR